MFAWQRFIPLTPFGGVVVVYILYRQIYNLTGIGDVDLAVPQAAWRVLQGPQAAVADLAARLTWGITALAFSIAFLAVLAVCLPVIWRASAEGARIPLLITAVLASAAGIAAGLMGNPLTLPKVADVLIDGFRLMRLDDGPFLLHFFNGLAMAAAMLLTFAASTTLAVSRSREPETDTLRLQAQRLRHVLFVGTAVLIGGSATTAAMHRLPIAFLNEPWSGALETFAQITVVATGTLWTLFLIAIYLPAAAILRSRFAQQAEVALPRADETERMKWITEHGLDLSPMQQLKRLTAILGPVLSSLPLAALFEVVGG